VHVLATAGHVDHGKSTLVRALTGTDPDRLEEERRRGLTIELGYAWTTLDPVGDVAFVDVPGHERFLRTMLAGVGPVPATLFVVAADDDWMPQAAEHLAALDALGVRHGVVAVSRCDLADPGPMLDRARRELAGTSLAGSPVVPVSAVTGAGLDRLRAELVALVRGLPDPPVDADVRLWVDRVFSVRGAGTVVTGTLPAGTVRVGDRLSSGAGTFRVRGVQALGRTVASVAGVARAALNLVPLDDVPLARDSVLVTPDAWHFTTEVDVRVAGVSPLPGRATLHVGAAAVPARVRPLGDDTVRLAVERGLPLRIGDRAILRDPGSRALWGLTVLDPAPPALRRRGAAAHRAAQLAGHPGTPDLAGELTRRRVVHASLLRRLGVPTRGDGWLISDEAAADLRSRLDLLVRRYDEAHPLEPGLTVAELARALELPEPDLVPPLVRAPLRVSGGRVTARAGGTLPAEVAAALTALADDLVGTPFAAPTADRLAELGLDRRAVAAAARAGELLDLGQGVVLLPGSDRLAAAWLADLPQPFTTSEARERLGTTRRVALPLLAHLDRTGVTRRHPDDRRSITRP
jgi:selenocysteine-specific elongation factor